jgi:DNA-binding GntR family transcriptional regulator
VLRAYLKRWKFEIGMFFQGVGPDAPDAKLLEIAPGYPVFRVSRPG